MLKRYIAALAVGAVLLSATAYGATSAEIQAEIDGYSEELSQSERTAEELEEQIAGLSEEAAAAYSEIQALNIERQAYAESMAGRIAYFYENEVNSGVLEALIGDGFAGFLDRLEHMTELYSYDAERLEAYTDVIEAMNARQEELDAEADELAKLKAEQEILQEELEGKISSKEAELAEAKKAEEEARAEKIKASQASTSSGGSGRTSGGKLTKQKGVVYYNGHRETYYSQRVLPGNGLNIPGRHVEASDGTVRDGDGYICVASSDLAKGTVVETSLGTGKVYDCGCASGTIDIYTDW